MSRFKRFLFVLCAALPAACSSHSHLISVDDLPLKEIELYDMDWQVSPLRANAQYVLFGAQSGKERRERLGDYYYVSWYDADKTRPIRLEMLYTQALTTSQVLRRTQDFVKPRSWTGTRKSYFFFNGAERARRGDVLTWRINLYVDGKLVDSQRSYLWRD